MTEPTNGIYLDFLRQLMLALIVSFQKALTMPETSLKGLIESLRAQLLPQGFKSLSLMQASNSVLLLSEEAIYIFQYLALMRQPAHDYLNSILNYIKSSLNVFIPGILLELLDPQVKE